MVFASPFLSHVSLDFCRALDFWIAARPRIWGARWVNGAAPREIAHGLYSLTRFKFRRVHTELEDHRWIKSLGY
jgi:hypothetical protein